MELLFHFCADEAIDGDLTKYEPEDIASKVRWREDAGVLITHLVDSGWLDKTPDGKLLMHDWSQHAPDHVHAKLARAGKLFADGKMPRMDKLNQKERERARRLFADQAPGRPPAAVDQAPGRPPAAVDQAPGSGKAGPLPFHSIPSHSLPSHSGEGEVGRGKGECEGETSPPPTNPRRRGGKRTDRQDFVRVGEVANDLGVGLTASGDGVRGAASSPGAESATDGDGDPGGGGDDFGEWLAMAEPLARLIEQHPKARKDETQSRLRRQALATRIKCDGREFVAECVAYAMRGGDPRCAKIASDLARFGDACLPANTGQDRLEEIERFMKSKHAPGMNGSNGHVHAAAGGRR